MRRGLLAAAAACLVLAIPRPAGGQQPDVEVRGDVEYARPGGLPVFLDAYLPPEPGPHPGLVVIAGGRWTYGDRKEQLGLGRAFASRGFVTLAVDHRPARRFPYPAPVEDVQAAVRWARDHAAELGLDPERIGALGASSAGHLAALLATAGAGPLNQGARVQAAVSWSGPMDLEALLQSSDPEIVRAVEWFLGCSGEACRGRAREASPAAHADPSDAALYLANSTDEVIPVEQATAMAGLLAEHGVPHELVEVPGSDHGMQYASDPLIKDSTLAFLQRWLVEAPSRPLPTTPPPPGGPGGEEGPPARPEVSPSPWPFLAAGAAIAAGVTLLARGRHRGPARRSPREGEPRARFRGPASGPGP